MTGQKYGDGRDRKGKGREERNGKKKSIDNAGQGRGR